jgi:hypothetical protein
LTKLIKNKVNEMMEQAQGGVLFVHEAYTLGGGTGRGRFSQEAADQLVKLMTDPEHLKKTVVILAGYKKPMERMIEFPGSGFKYASSCREGLRSRFEGRIEFPDWSADDCVVSIRQTCEGQNIRLMIDAEHRLLQSLREIKERPGWANARDSITTYRLLYAARAQRCMHVAEAEACFTVEDAAAAMAKLKAQRPPGERVLDANGLAAGGSFVAGDFVADGDFGTNGLSQMMSRPPLPTPRPQRYSECRLVDFDEVEMRDASAQHDPAQSSPLGQSWNGQDDGCQDLRTDPQMFELPLRRQG